MRLGDNDEICVRGPNVLHSYWERPDATADAFRDGWFLTGDIGEFDGDGYLSIVGRSKDLIITGGFNVYPREIEELLAEHPAVAEAAVAGEPSDEWGETVVAYVVTADAVSEADLIEWCGRTARQVQAAAPRAIPRCPASQRAREGGEERPQDSTVIVPCMFEWILQWKAIVPALSVVNWKLPPPSTLFESNSPLSAVNVWAKLSSFLNVTVSPTFTVILCGVVGDALGDDGVGGCRASARRGG